jgi:hypothetical protein
MAEPSHTAQKARKLSLSQSAFEKTVVYHSIRKKESKIRKPQIRNLGLHPADRSTG